MDRSTRALATAEDAMIKIDALYKRVQGASKQAAFAVYVGTVDSGRAQTSFGTYKSEGVAAVVAFGGGGEETLKFAGGDVATSTSPILAVIPSGEGELSLSGSHGEARALVLGPATKTR